MELLFSFLNFLCFIKGAYEHEPTYYVDDDGERFNSFEFVEGRFSGSCEKNPSDFHFTPNQEQLVPPIPIQTRPPTFTHVGTGVSPNTQISKGYGLGEDSEDLFCFEEEIYPTPPREGSLFPKELSMKEDVHSSIFTYFNVQECNIVSELLHQARFNMVHFSVFFNLAPEFYSSLGGDLLNVFNCINRTYDRSHSPTYDIYKDFSSHMVLFRMKSLLTFYILMINLGVIKI